MSSKEALELVKKAVELAAPTLANDNAPENEKALAGLLQDTAITLMQAVEFIQVLRLESDEGRRLLNLAKKVVMEAMDSTNPTQALLNAGEQMTVDGQACCDCDTCSEGCGCGEDTDPCAGCEAGDGVGKCCGCGEDTDDGRSDKCTDGCSCDDSSECASCPTPPKNLMN